MRINGKEVRAIMARKNMNQITLAWMANIDPGLLGVILAGGDCPEELAQGIADTLCVDIEEIAETANSQVPEKGENNGKTECNVHPASPDQ